MLHTPACIHMSQCMCAWINWIVQEASDSECWRINSWSQKASFEGNHHFSINFKVSNRSSCCNLWISHTSHEMTVSPMEIHGMELESKAWINYPQLLQEQGFKGYISDHNLWRVTLSPPPLTLAETHTHAHMQRQRCKSLILTCSYLISLL